MENGNKLKIKFNWSCLRQGKTTFNHGKIVAIYIVYEISKNYNLNSYPRHENCLFGAVSLTEHPDIDLYKCFGYEIGFDKKGFFSHPSGRTGRNVIIFGVGMSSSLKIDHRKKDILILLKGPTQEFEDALSKKKMY